MSNDAPEYDHIFKLKIIGDIDTGKSSIVLRFCDNTYTESDISMIDIDFKTRTIDIDCKRIKLQLWDRPNPYLYRFRNRTDPSYRGSHAFIVVFDVTNQESFSDVEGWLRECEVYERTLKYIVGTKCELFSDSVVDYSTANSFAQQYGLKYFECSSKCNINIDDIFSTISLDILERSKFFKDEEEKKRNQKVIVVPKKKRKERGCAGKIQ